jgi:hypothetical protein
MSDLANEFRAYATQCRDMAQTVHEAEARAAWQELADKWLERARVEDEAVASDERADA